MPTLLKKLTTGTRLISVAMVQLDDGREDYNESTRVKIAYFLVLLYVFHQPKLCF